jgi:tetratricopeptide (TPR) repeat protein
MDEAIEEYKRALEINPDHLESRLTLANTYLELGQHGAALEVAGKLPDSIADLADVRLLLGSIHAKLGHADLARKHLAVLSTANPEYAQKLQDLLTDPPSQDHDDAGGLNSRE